MLVGGSEVPWGSCPFNPLRIYGAQLLPEPQLQEWWVEAEHPRSCLGDRYEGWECVLVFIKGLPTTTHPFPLSPVQRVSLRVGRWGYILCPLFRISSQWGKPTDCFHYQLSLWLWLWCLLMYTCSMVAGSLTRSHIVSSVGQLLSSPWVL